MNRRTLFSLVALIGFASLLLFSFGQQVTVYTGFAEAEATGGHAKVAGKWAADQPTHYDPGANRFVFHMADESGAIRPVHYRDPKPASFENAEMLVIEGRSVDGVFEAETILMKCPSKYSDTLSLEGG